tara:strand:+ start:48 stop:287 length:240 start_codon:yes stop_codon:yes gene_type:complete
MNIYEHIRQARVYSYILTCIVVYWLSGTLVWIHDLDINTLSTESVALATAVLTALVALLRFIFSFAAIRSPLDRQGSEN